MNTLANVTELNAQELTSVQGGIPLLALPLAAFLIPTV